MDETFDAFLGGRVHAYQPKNGFRAGTDTVLLAASVEATAGQRILELGCGSGVAMLCLAARLPEVELFGLELVEDNVERAARNFQKAGLEAQIAQADIFSTNHKWLKDQFDHVYMNPPFYSDRQHTHPLDKNKANAHIAFHPVSMWIKAGLKRIRAQGKLTVIYPTEALSEILSAIPPENSVKILPVTTKEGELSKRIIVQITTQRRNHLKLLAPLILNSRLGDKTEIGENIARFAGGINWD